MRRNITKTSKFLSLILRHKPELIGIALDSEGWANIGELIEKARAYGRPLTGTIIHEIVATSEKWRFSIKNDGMHVRASHDHPQSGGLEESP